MDPLTRIRVIRVPIPTCRLLYKYKTIFILSPHNQSEETKILNIPPSKNRTLNRWLRLRHDGLKKIYYLEHVHSLSRHRVDSSPDGQKTVFGVWPACWDRLDTAAYPHWVRLLELPDHALSGKYFIYISY